MADTNTGDEAAEQNAGASAEGNENGPTDSQTADQGDGGGDAGAEGGEGDDADDDDDSDSDSDEDEEEETFEDDGSEPTVRDTSYYVGLRHGKKAARQSKKDTNAGDDDEGDGSDDDDEDDDIHPEDREILNSAVQNAVKPLTDKLAKQEDAKELNAFLTENPAFKPYEKRIERFMQHPTRKGLPVSTIAMEAVGTEGMMKIGARMARSADHKKQTSKSAPGGGKRGGGDAKNVWDMPADDFSKMQEEVRRKG